jgi:hypothetical protein
MGATSNNPATRFLSRFIIELGRKGNQPYDLLSPALDLSAVQLDPIQTFLIVYRLAGDIATRAGLGQSTMPANRAMAALPCTLNDTQEIILDTNSLALTLLFGEIIEHSGLENVGRALGIASALATAAKVIAAYAVLQADILMDPPVLERTKDTTPGKTATLTATLRSNTGKWQLVNCFRALLNIFTIDFDLPQNGPVEGAGIEWQLTDTGRAPWSIMEGHWVQHFLDYVAGNGIVYMETEGPDRRDRIAPWNHVTDSNGKSQLRVTGSPQSRDLSKELIKEVEKSFTVKVNVRLKRLPEGAAGLTQEALDILGAALDGIIGMFRGEGIGIGTLIDVAGEVALRNHWYSPVAKTFPVIDWEPCNGRWAGTITFELHRQTDIGPSPPAITGLVTHADEVQYQTGQVTSTLLDTVGANGEIFAGLEMPIDATFSYRRKDQAERFAYGTNDQIVFCASFVGGATVNGAGLLIPSPATNPASVDIRNGEYHIEVPMTYMMTEGSNWSSAFVTPGCVGVFGLPYSDFSTSAGLANPDRPFITVDGKIDANNPNVLHGTNTNELQVGTTTVTVVTTWNLTRACGPPR